MERREPLSGVVFLSLPSFHLVFLPKIKWQGKERERSRIEGIYDRRTCGKRAKICKVGVKLREGQSRRMEEGERRLLTGERPVHSLPLPLSPPLLENSKGSSSHSFHLGSGLKRVREKEKGRKRRRAATTSLPATRTAIGSIALSLVMSTFFPS